ncbi:hypothetical protein O9G_001682 [Rozella allomycis CSF55]|uniref:Uncharacterized protein n=1 Tax=Rozella allomycis (strain CSF55) TaxID=988480 RepID=A0A075AXH7_ROZAC|nr:hypothetical protein O9G_001682 [Rozella allomycis CSF55]|eukprot:EPZ34952.1 hypothetical protein O9G_001682 [Rozella allomycis CSF55]
MLTDSVTVCFYLGLTDKTTLEFKVNSIHVTNVCEEIGPRLLLDIDFYNPTLLNAVIGDITIKLYFKNSSEYDLIETNSVDLIINSRERNIAEGTSLRFFATVRTNSFIFPLVASIDRSIALNDLFGENHETEAENKNWPFSIKNPKESAGFMVELAKSGYEAFIIDFPDTNFQINLFNSEQRILDVLVHSGTFKTDDEPMKVEFSTSRKYEFRITEFVKMLQNKEDIPLVFSFKNNQKCQILNLLDDAQLKLEISTKSDVLNDKKPDSIKSVRHLKEMNDEYSLNGEDEPNFEFLTGFPIISIETQLQRIDIEDKLLSFELLNLTIESRAEKDFLNIDVKIQTSNLPDTLKGFTELISRSEEYEYCLRMSSGMYENDLVATNAFEYDDSLNPLLYSISSKIKSEKYTVYSNFNASLPTDTLGGPHIKLSQKVRVLNMGLDESFLHFNLGLFQLSSDFVTSLHGGQVIWHADIKLIRRDGAIADLLFSFFKGESFDSVKMSFFIHSNLRQRYEGEWPGFLLKDSLRPVRVDFQLSISDVDLYLKRNDEFRGETTSMLKISMDELYISAALDCKQNSVFKYVTIKQNKWDNVKNIQGIRVNATILDSKSFFLLLQDYLYFDKRNEYKEDFESEIKDRLKNMKNREKDEIVAVIKLYLNLDNELNMLSRIIAMMIYSKPVFQYGTYYELNNAKVNNLKIYEASALLAEPTPDSAKKHIDESKLKLEIKSPDLKSMDIVFTFSLPKSETVEDIKNIPSGVFIIKWGKIDVSLMYQSSLIFRFQLEQNSLPIRLGNSPHSELFSTPDIKLTVSTYSELGVSRDFLDFFQRIFGYWENKEKQLPSFHFEGFIYNYNDCAIQHNNIKTFIKSNGIDGDDIRNLISSRQQIKVDEDFNFFSFLDWVPNFKAIIKDKNFPCFIPYFCDFFKIQSFSEPFQVSIVIDLESELTSFFQNISSEIFSILDIFSFNMNITQLRFEFSSDPIFFDIFVNGFSMIMIDAKQFMFSMTSNRKPTDNFKKSAQIVEPINITIKTTNQYADAYNVLKSLEMFQVFAPTSIASPSVKNLNIKTIPFDNFTLSYGQSDVARTNLLSNILSNVINEMQVENYAFNLQDYINVKVIKTEKSFLTLQFILDKYLDSNLNKFLSDGFKINLYEKENILFNVYYHNSDLFLMLYNDKMQVTRWAAKDLTWIFYLSMEKKRY